MLVKIQPANPLSWLASSNQVIPVLSRTENHPLKRTADSCAFPAMAV
jgi:hypothetical protein